MSEHTGTPAIRTNNEGKLLDADGNEVVAFGVLTMVPQYAEHDPLDPMQLIVTAVLEAECPSCGKSLLYGWEPGAATKQVAVRHEMPGPCKVRLNISPAPIGHPLYLRHCVRPEDSIRIAAKTPNGKYERFSRQDLVHIYAKHAPPLQPNDVDD